MAKPIKVWSGTEWLDIAISIPNLTDYVTTATFGSHLASPAFSGAVTINSIANYNATSTSITDNTQTQIATLPIATYRSAEFVVQVTQGSKYTMSKVLMLHDGSTSHITEYGLIELGESRIPLTLSTTIDASNALLLATITDASSTNASVKVVRTGIVL